MRRGGAQRHSTVLNLDERNLALGLLSSRPHPIHHGRLGFFAPVGHSPAKRPIGFAQAIQFSRVVGVRGQVAQFEGVAGEMVEPLTPGGREPYALVGV